MSQNDEKLAIFGLLFGFLSVFGLIFSLVFGFDPKFGSIIIVLFALGLLSLVWSASWLVNRHSQ